VKKYRNHYLVIFWVLFKWYLDNVAINMVSCQSPFDVSSIKKLFRNRGSFYFTFSYFSKWLTIILSFHTSFLCCCKFPNNLFCSCKNNIVEYSTLFHPTFVPGQNYLVESLMRFSFQSKNYHRESYKTIGMYYHYLQSLIFFLKFKSSLIYEKKNSASTKSSLKLIVSK
jgi:hypothetical protein